MTARVLVVEDDETMAGWIERSLVGQALDTERYLPYRCEGGGIEQCHAGASAADGAWQSADNGMT